MALSAAEGRLPNRSLVRRQIRDNLLAIKPGTTPTGSTLAYKSTVNSVKVRTKRATVEVSPDDLPQIQLWGFIDTNQDRPGRQLFIRWEMDLMVYVNDVDATEGDVSELLDKLYDDIMACMYQDMGLTRDGTRISFRVEYLGSFEGIHPDVEDGQLRMRFAIHWQRNTRTN